MHNIEYIRNLMLIHREFGHLVTDETKNKFDMTITAAIIALSEYDELTDEEVAEVDVSQVH